ncbi:MAG: hypothetical protein ABIS69_05955 [Sediminibacterium sp.]
MLALVAGMLCPDAFIVKMVSTDATDDTLLAAGIFIFALGISAWYRK